MKCNKCKILLTENSYNEEYCTKEHYEEDYYNRKTTNARGDYYGDYQG